MRFIAMGKVKGGTEQERLARRMQWQYPQGVKPIAEYWTLGAEYGVVSIVEAESAAPIMATLMAWSDFFEWRVAPAITAEEGLQMAQQMMQTQKVP